MVESLSCAPDHAPDLADLRPCRAPGADLALWFPEGKQPLQVARAKALCAACPVRAACLAAALARNERFGIWGGLTPAERQPLPRRHPCRRCGGPAPVRLAYCSDTCRAAARRASQRAYDRRQAWSAA